MLVFSWSVRATTIWLYGHHPGEGLYIEEHYPLVPGPDAQPTVVYSFRGYKVGHPVDPRSAKLEVLDKDLYHPYIS
jgi:hypothetical protein